jgi:hypothetical protein
MSRKICQYLIPAFLLLGSAAIAVWTGIVVKDNHSVDTFKDSPNSIPIVNATVGLVALVLFLTNFFRVFGCYHNRGCCDSGLGMTSFILMVASAVALFSQVARLNDNERDYYRHELNNYYKLTVGQMTFFCVYFVMVVFQLICHLCGCVSSCVGDDDNDYDGGEKGGKTVFA